MTSPVYIVAGRRPWNRDVFDRVISHFPGTWHFVTKKKELNIELLQRLQPARIFFLHWSWKVPLEMISDYECICFHMTDVPYGRGGSPLQNLILAGKKTTMLTALRMEEEMDSGPVYLKEFLALSGSAQEIFIRSSELSATMIRRIIQENLTPMPQKGEPVFFKRRSPEQSKIVSGQENGEKLYDFIRMLDAEGYPKAFLQHEGMKYEFSQAQLVDGEVIARVLIRPIEEKKE